MTMSLNKKNDFPIFAQKNRGQALVYLDTASSAQKPECVIRAMTELYQNDYANIHRGVYELSERATRLYENTRDVVKRFINAPLAKDIVFTSGTTASINLVVQSYAKSMMQANDEVILTTMEHHANIVPWYMLAQEKGIEIKVAPITQAGEIDLAAYEALFTKRTKMVAMTHASNAIGTINPIKQMIAIAHAHGAVVLIDGAQAVAHMPVDVQDLDCDFYVFSAHKLYGPTGTGVLYAKSDLLDMMPPYQGGGDMIETVDFSHVTYAKAPQSFEAGTPNIAGVVGLSAAINYLEKIGMQAIFEHDQALRKYAEKKLAEMPGIRMIGTASNKLAILSFVVDGIHPHDIGTILDNEGVAIRAGHHCAMPLMTFYQVPATARASIGIYNDSNDIDVLLQAILSAKRLFA